MSQKGSTATSNKRLSDSIKDDPPPTKKKITLNVATSKPSLAKTTGISMKAGSTSLSIKLPSKQEKKSCDIKIVPKSKKTAAVFNESSDSEPEEMPSEARMRMKNIGRDTPTSSGPNSFNKGKLGFVDNQRAWELQQEALLVKLKTKKRKSHNNSAM